MSATTVQAATAAGLRPMKAGEEEAHFAAVAADMRAKETRKAIREGLKTAALVLAVPLVASGWYAREVSPRIQEKVEFIPITEKGVIARGYEWEDLPASAKADNAMTTMWNYVRHREAYSHILADYSWRLVTALSDGKTADEYKRDHNPANPASPWKRYGEDTRVDVAFDGVTDLCTVEVCPAIPEGYRFWFWRTEIVKGAPQRPVMYSAAMRFRRGLADVPGDQRATINGPAAQVWEYVPGAPVGAQRGSGR